MDIMSGGYAASRVQALAPNLSRYGRQSSGRFIKRRQAATPKPTAAERYNFDPQINRHEVLIEWGKLSIFPAQVIREQFTKLIQLCNDTDKDELVIVNIAPSFRVGTHDLDEVLAIQNQIVSTLLGVATSFQRGEPETRLSLRRGEFDIRVYLGATCPRDLDYKEER